LKFPVIVLALLGGFSALSNAHVAGRGDTDEQSSPPPL
jgi:hypothetical protein